MAVNKNLALKRINQLFEQAELEDAYADRYVSLARKIAMKAQLSMPKSLRRKYCHNCYSYIIVGKTGRIRLYKGNIVITCLKCGNIDRYPLK